MSNNEQHSPYMAMNPLKGLESTFGRIHNFAAAECIRFFTPDEFGLRIIEELLRNHRNLEARTPFRGFQPVVYPPPPCSRDSYITSFIIRWLRERCGTYTMMPFISSNYYTLYKQNDRLYGNLGDNTRPSQPQKWLNRKALLTRQLFAEERFDEWISHFVYHVVEDEETPARQRPDGLAADLWRTLHPLLRPAHDPDFMDFHKVQFQRIKLFVTEFVLACLRLEAEPIRWHWYWPLDRETEGDRTWRTCSRPGISKVVIRGQPGNVPILSLQEALEPRGLFL